MGIISNNYVIFQNGGYQTGADQTWNNPETGYQRKLFLGFMDNYYKGVVPLALLDNSSISRYSYTSGRIEIIRYNGVAWHGPAIVDFKIQKNYNSTDYHWTEMHRNSSYVQKCKFTWNGLPWGGIAITAPSIHAHTAWFYGMSYHDYGGAQMDQWYIPYYRTDTSSVLNSEIYNSLSIQG